MPSRDDMFKRARERAVGFQVPTEWGQRVDLEEDDEVGFFGRYLGTATDPDADEGRETVYLFANLDEDGAPAWFRNSSGSRASSRTCRSVRSAS
jgi:hypothetical protein